MIIKRSIRILLLFVLISQCRLNAFTQQVAIKSLTGPSGPVLESLKVVDLLVRGARIQSCGTSTVKSYECTDRVEVKFGFSGKIKRYAYKGKVYASGYQSGNYKDCAAYCFDCSGTRVRVKGKIQAGSREYAFEEVSSSIAGSVHRIYIDISTTRIESIKLLSLSVEPVSYPAYEKALDKWEACQQKEKEEAGLTKVTKNETEAVGDDDFWNGSAKAVSKNKTVSEKRGVQTSSSTETSDGFWTGARTVKSNNGDNSGAYAIKSEKIGNDLYSWVEDADGSILIPKGNYSITEYKDGLAKVSRLLRTDYFDYVKRRKVQLFEKALINGNGERLPPATYQLDYSVYTAFAVLWSSKLSDAEIAAIKRRDRLKDEDVARRLKAYYSALGYTIQ